MAMVRPMSTLPGARRKLELFSPQTLARIGEFEVATAQDVKAAVEAARKAQPAWAALPFAKRAEYIQRAMQILLQKQDEYIEIVLRETGKARSEAIMMEVYACLDVMHYYSKRAEKILKPRKLKLHGVMSLLKKASVIYKPRGVVGVISPWNGPVILALNPTIQALMAGNTVVLKPSEVTPFSGKIVYDMLAEAGIPSGVMNIVLGDGETGAALTKADVDKIAFTGSVATGRKVAMACAEKLIPCTLELGGKDPMIVCEDADLDIAAAGAVVGSLMNTGHYCCGTERIYVVDSVADAFLEKVVERVKQMRQGDQGEYDVGAVFWEKQMDIIEAHMVDAVKKGAKVLIGGKRNAKLKGLYFEPTVITDLTHDMDIIREETFGPIVAILRVKDEEEALRMANDTRFGLGANVWSRDSEKASALACRIDSGSACVNDMTMTFGVPEAPFGGRKESGVGQVNGETGLRGYCHAQPIIVDRHGGKMILQHYPYTAKKDEDMKKAMQFFWGTTFGRWFS